MIDQFKIKNVRCFDGEHCVQIRPLTLLVGENSAGKTTLLGCYFIWMQFLSSIYTDRTWDLPRKMIRWGFHVNFNTDPYQMGENIARHPRQSRGKNAKFSIGMTHKAANGKWEIDATFAEKHGLGTHLEEITMSLPAGARIIYRISKTKPTKTKHAQIALNKKGNELTVTFTEDGKGLRGIDDEIERFRRTKIAKMPPELQDIFKHERFSGPFTPRPEHIENLAPVRSQPKRTYDSISVSPSSKGDDIPMHMMRLARNTSTQSWKILQKKLASFGKSSGMFKGVEVIKLGRDMSAFQIKIDMGHRKENIMDVGYGISQILPVLVRMMSQPARTKDRIPFSRNLRFLLQQPEVHLHPQAQAEFASLVARFVSETAGEKYLNRQGCLIETHGDNIIDRIRLEIRRKAIRPEDVSLVYHEKTSKGAKLHNIEFDEMGTLLGAPGNYREFFTKETKEFLGF